jgi:lysophospholipase L1-like esterase
LDVGAVLIDAPNLLLPSTEHDGPDSALFSDVVHLSIPGHRALAELISPELRELLRD